MNVLFLCLSKVWDIKEREIYSDLLREFVKYGNNVFVVTPVERKYKESTQLVDQGKAKILKVKTLNIQKTHIIEKGLGTFLIEFQYLSAIKKHFSGIQFDLILYSTPPITLVKPIAYVKKRDGAKTYLLLKDIFPQNAIDIGIMSKSGIKGLLYKFFRKKEKQLYEVSDHIGCMSQANVDYVLKHNPKISPQKVEICPNSIEFVDMSLTESERLDMRSKYDLPLDKKVFVYGGNLGKPQGIPFLIDCLRAEKESQDAFFLIVGDGTEYDKLHSFVFDEKPQNVKLMKRLPKEDYDRLVAACDVGMIFLDHRFTIPNFPSRLLSYMQAGLPVLACTDPITDIGKTIEEGKFGWWCESNSVSGFKEIVSGIVDDNTDYSAVCIDYLKTYYSANITAERIVNSCHILINEI